MHDLLIPLEVVVAVLVVTAVLLIGVASGLTAVFLPAASEAVIYVLMAVVLLIRPRGLFGEEGMMS